MNQLRESVDTATDFNICLRLREFRPPAVPDVLVLGRRSAIGCHALRKALHLLAPVPLVHFELDDEAISDLLVREALLARIPQAWLEHLILQHVRPRMRGDEILQLELDLEWRLQMVERHDAAVRP